MSTTNTHYVVDATIRDARIGSSDTRTTTTQISVLAEDEAAAGNLVVEFFTNSDIDSTLADGVHALVRSVKPTGAGAIRSVQINSVTVYVAPAPTPTTVTTTVDVKPTGRTAKAAKIASDAILAAKAAVTALESEVETEVSESISTTTTTVPVETATPAPATSVAAA